MMIALDEAKKAYKKNEVPIGAVIVKNGKIISKGYNQKETKKIVTRHAEIVAIEKACRKIKNWHLNDCTIYITLEPCMMCVGAIVQSRISKIVYATKSPKFGAVKHLNDLKNLTIEEGICEKEAKLLLQSFFQSRR